RPARRRTRRGHAGCRPRHIGARRPCSLSRWSAEERRATGAHNTTRRHHVNEAAAVTRVVEPTETPLTPESWGKLGMWVFLVGDAMSFGGLLAAYAALRISNSDWPVPSTKLGIGLTAVMTFLLICSSVTMVKALSAIRHGN